MLRQVAAGQGNLATVSDGWEPAGGLGIGMSNNAQQFYQALTRKKKTPETIRPSND